MKTEADVLFKKDDIVWVHGLGDPRVSKAWQGVVHHHFIGHDFTFTVNGGQPQRDVNYVISIPELDGEFIVRENGTVWSSEKTYKVRI